MDRKIEKKKWGWRRMLSVVGTVALLILGIYAVLASNTSAVKVEGKRISVAAVSQGDFQEIIPASGTVEPLKTVMVDATEGGRVEEIFAEDGDLVEKGQPLVRLSNTGLMLDFMNRETQIIEQINNLRSTRIQLQQNQRQTQDQLLDIENQLNLIQRQHQADAKMAEKEMISDIEYYNSQTNYEHLKKKKALTELRVREDELYRSKQMERIDRSIELMERNLDAIRKNLESLVIKAPMSGQLNSFDPEIGETRAKGQNMGRIDQTEAFKLTALVDQYYLNRIKIGQRADFEYGGRSYSVTVKKVSPTIVGSQFEIELEFGDQVPGNLTRGQQFQLRISLSATTQAVLIPRGSFYQSTGGKWVFVIDEQGYGTRRPIKLGRPKS